MPSKTPAADLLEMLNSMDRIRAYVAGMDEAAFIASMVSYDAVLMNLIVIGEAANRLPQAIIAAEPTIPWRDVIGMRNRIAHGYEDVEPQRIWNTITLNLPALRAAVQRLLDVQDPP
jgi:uncharacterized protein with HEPN domain